MVTITGTVESAGFDSGSLRLLSQTGADDLSSGDIAAVAVDHGTNFSFSRGGAHQNAIAGSRNDAGTDVYENVKAEMEIPSKLLEHVCGRIVKRLFRTFPTVKAIELKLAKRNPPMEADLDAAGVEVQCERV